MGSGHRVDRSRLRLLLASSSVVALLLGSGAPSAYAACTPVPAGGIDNVGSVSGLCVTGPVTGTVANSGAITASGIKFINGSLAGQVVNSGEIIGGISLDGQSQITGNQTGIVILGTTFAGGISSAGTISVSASAIVLNGVSTFSGGITNSGTITAAGNGINVHNVGAISDGIVNSASGSIVATSFGVGILVGNVTAPGVYGVSSFGGSVTNAGTISSAGGTGIQINGVSTFTGSVTNSGTISAAGNGMRVENVLSFTGNLTNATGGSITAGVGIEICNCVTSFLGGVTNAGIIHATGQGILVTGVSVFGTTSGGGITNSGTIAASTGIEITGVATVAGGILNTGTITSGGDGIDVFAGTGGITTFSGGITNSGTIAAASHGIFVGGTAEAFGGGTSAVTISNFSGGISNNNGRIVATTGILVGGIAFAASANANVTISTFSGGITNTGTIIASSSYGIIVGGAAEIFGTGSASVAISSFSGDISNSGTIIAPGANGIFVGGTVAGSGATVIISNFSANIINSGTISAGGVGIFVGATAFSTGVTISTFSGDIRNNGSISAAAGIVVSGVSTFTGNIVNSSNGGTITASSGTGIAVARLVSFTGTVSNGGAIFAQRTGILVEDLSVYTGDVSNSGTIVASAGIVVGCSCGISTFAGNINNSGFISASRTGIFVTNVTNFIGGITNGGTITAGYAGIFFGPSSGSFVTLSKFTGGITNSGTINAGHAGIFVGATSGSVFHLSTFAGGISNGGTIGASFAGIFVGASGGGSVRISTFSGGITNSGTITAGSFGIIVGASPGSSFRISTFSGNISNAGTIIAGTGIYIGAGVKFDSVSAIVNTGIITGTGGTAINLLAATSPVTIDINGGTINGDMIGAGLGHSDVINFALGAGTFTYAAPYGFSGFDQVNINSGTVVLNGVNNALSVAVNNGGTLAGTGTLDFIPSVNINSGGTLEPGIPGGFGTFTIDATLNFNANSFYAVSVAPGAGNNSSAVVNGTANLGGNGTVVATPQIGHYNAAIYQILTPTTLAGKFAGLTVNGVFTGSIILDYTTNPGDVDLDITGSSLIATPPGANVNQTNVLNGVNNGIINSPANVPLPSQFLTLGSLSGPALLRALSQVDGEAATDAQKGAFQLTSEFLSLMLDPFVDGRGGSSGGGASGFAPEQQPSFPPDIALAYAGVLKAPPAAATFERRWSAWGASFGGSGTTDGNAAVGSNTVTAQTYGFAAGMDYHATPDTVYGFALAGGGTNWGLAQGLGSGRSDAFQAGVYGTTHMGPAYLAGALAFTNHAMTTNRIALGDQLNARFDAQSYGARLEGGYRYALQPMIGVTPYAALQAQSFHTPSYSETDLTGGGFGLSYNAMSATDTRSELGARFDDLTAWSGMPLTLRARAAWAHDWVSNPALGAAFQTLPGSNFVVNGAAPPKNSALTSAGAELRITPRWSLTAKFDGEFAAGSQTYAGTGTLRYSW